MKKLVIAMALFLGVAGASSNALAYFDDGLNGSLVLSIYNADNNEIAIDLGPVNDVVSLQNVILAPAGSWNIDMFPGLTLDDLNGAVRAMDSNKINYYNSFVGVNHTGPLNVRTGTQFQLFGNNNAYTLGTYKDYSENGTQQTALLESAHDNSYFWRMVGNGDLKGVYGGLVRPLNDETEADMGLLATQGYSDLYLFQYLRDVAINQWILPTSPIAVIRMMADGSVVMNPTVPLPGSLILLSSGLLGMVGIRRRKNA